MRTFSHTFTASGQRHEFPGGNFFQILTLDTSTVDVEFFHKATQQSEENGFSVPAGYVSNQRKIKEELGRDTAFDAVHVISKAAQTIEVGISRGQGGLNRFTGDVNITNSAVPIVGEFTYKDSDSVYWRNTTSNALHTIFTPAANANGAVIKQMVADGNNNILRVMAKTSAPGSFADTGAITLHLAARTTTAGMIAQNVTPPPPFKLEAGLGLYEQNQGNVLSIVSITYELL